MDIRELPLGKPKKTLAFDHFPTRWQAFIWRNRSFVPDRKLAEILQCTEAEIRQAAVELGMPAENTANALWLSHGYLTVIRNNWHLLDYGQLLQLLDWTPERLRQVLCEEDFLWTKVGELKPDCEKLRYIPLTGGQREQTACFKQRLRKHVSASAMAVREEAFAFSRQYHGGAVPSGKGDFELNFIHAYPASCGDVLIDIKTNDPAPESLLAQYAAMGIKGIWIHTILYLLHPVPGAETYSAGHEKRLQNLRLLAERCSRYGISLYLYLNEPRGMPQAFYRQKPDWAGVDVPSKEVRSNCTANPDVLKWLGEACTAVFQEVRGLGGAFMITMSENPTHCGYAWRHHGCPHCRNRNLADMIAEIITAMERGIHAAAPDAKLLVYDWAWRANPEEPDGLEFRREMIDRLPDNVWLMSVSEWNKKIRIGGIDGYVSDYSISQVGPSQEMSEVWQYAKARGLKTAAKIQINNSWELSAVPYLPVPYLLQEHLTNLKNAGVDGLMLSWTLGGYPGGNLELLNKTPEEIARATFSPDTAAGICSVWHKFSEAFRNFPFSIIVIYTGPMNFGPKNLLYAEPTHYNATMVGYPYDDLESWRSIYPEDVFEHQFELLVTGWRSGLAELDALFSRVTAADIPAYEELKRIATAAYCHFYSTLEQIRFIRARQRADKNAMVAALQEEIQTARKLYELQCLDSRIGFEASNHYYYTPYDLLEKIINCEQLIDTLMPIPEEASCFR